MPSDGLPRQPEVEEALLALLRSRRKPVLASDAYRTLAGHFRLTREQQTRVRPSEPRSEWENLV